MPRIAWLPSLGLCALVACGVFDPDEQRVLGTLYGGEGAFVVPQTAAAGVEFFVRVTTGIDPCGRPGAIDVRIDGRAAFLTPYDVLEEYDVCTAAPPSPFTHEAKLVFAEPGAVSITVRAVSDETRGLVELTRTVQIQ